MLKSQLIASRSSATVPALPGVPIFEAATGAVVGIADSPTSILSCRRPLALVRSARRAYLARSGARATTASATPTSSTSTATSMPSPASSPRRTRLRRSRSESSGPGGWASRSCSSTSTGRSAAARREAPKAIPQRARRAVQRLGVQRNRGGVAGSRPQDRRETRPGHRLAVAAKGMDTPQVEPPAGAPTGAHGRGDGGPRGGGCVCRRARAWARRPRERHRRRRRRAWRRWSRRRPRATPLRGG